MPHLSRIPKPSQDGFAIRLLFDTTSPPDGTAYKAWSEGREYKVDYIDTNKTTVLRSESTNWAQMDDTGQWWQTASNYGGAFGYGPHQYPEYNPRIASKTLTIVDKGAQPDQATQVSEVDYSYDTNNNETERDEYDFGTNTKGALLRATCTTYFGGYSGSPYILDLPATKKVSAAVGCTSAAPKSSTAYAYDESAYPPVDESGITSHDATYGTSNLGRGNPTTVAQAVYDTVNGNTTLTSHFQYDIAGNVLKTIDPRCVERDYSYSDSPTGTTYAFATSVTSYVNSTKGTDGTCSNTVPLAASASYDYHTGRVTSTKDVNLNVTSYEHDDSLERLTKITRPDSGTTVFTYTDTPGSLSVYTTVDQATAGDKKMKSYTFYDGLGREIETSKQAGTQNIVVCKTWDGRGRLASQSNPAVVTDSNIAFGTTGGCGTDTISYTYDGLNRILTTKAQDGSSVTSYGYGADATTHRDRTAIVEPGARDRLQYYDGARRLTQVDENATSCPQVTCGIAGQATLSTTYGYNEVDDLTSVSQSGQTRSFTYDSVKRLVRANNPESGAISYSYDAGGNVATRTDANSSKVTFAYDGLNRITSKSYTAGTGVVMPDMVTYAYDSTQSGTNGIGRLTSVTAGTKLVNNYNSYDWAGRVTSGSQVTDSTTYSMSYGYDLAGELTSYTFPSLRKLTMSYDTGGRTTGVSGNYQSNDTSYADLSAADAYFANGAIQHVGLGPNNLLQQYCQNSLLQITGVRFSKTSTLTSGCINGGTGATADVLNLGLTWGTTGSNNGNLTVQTIATSDGLNVTQTYGYDPYNRLQTASEGAGWGFTYGYDAVGNQWLSAYSGSFTPPANTPQSQLAFDASTNRINQNNARTDSAGNLLHVGSETFTYDAENRMVGSTLATTTVTYSYDGEGRRVKKEIKDTSVNPAKTTTTTYVYDVQGQVAAEYVTGTVTGDGCATCYLMADHLGSTRLMTDKTGAVVARHDYYPLGGEIASGVGGRGATYGVVGHPNTKFTGKERDSELVNSADPDGLDYFGARYFSGAQGRFTTPDWSAKPTPIPYADLNDPQSLNLYAYVRNNPLKNRDPDGHICIFGIGNTCTSPAPPPAPKPPAAPANPAAPVYPTVDQAGAAAARADKKQTDASRNKGNPVEYGNSVYTVAGVAYTYTTPVTSNKRNTVNPNKTTGLDSPPIPGGTALVGEAHSHPDIALDANGNRASARDQLSFQDRNRTLSYPDYQKQFQAEYVALPDGTVIKYDIHDQLR